MRDCVSCCDLDFPLEIPAVSLLASRNSQVVLFSNPEDLADLHMKYDVTKQEINFFQSKLKAPRGLTCFDMNCDDSNY